MKFFLSLIVMLILGGRYSVAGVGGGGTTVGTDRTMLKFISGIDYVRAASIKNGEVVFHYKAFDKNTVETYKLLTSSLKDSYKEAIKASFVNHTWTAVQE